MMQDFEKFSGKIAEIRQLGFVMSLLNWDQQVYMPPAGAQSRGLQQAALATIRHKLQTDSELVDLIAKLKSTPGLTDEMQVVVREAGRDIELARKVPVELVSALARQESETHDTWLEARKAKNFAVVKDSFGELLKLKREQAQALSVGRPDAGSSKDALYDSLLDLYEPEAKSAEIATLFAHVGPELSELLRFIATRAPEKKVNPARAGFPRENQREFLTEVVKKMGFDFNSGRIDETVHPFCSDVGAGDVRLTVRYNESDIAPGLYGAIHEAGHGLYEQGFLLKNAYTPLAEAVSLGIHESQSLLWEKRIGRSKPFWDHFYPRLQQLFPAALSEVSLDKFFRHINDSRPSLNRVDSDEVSYGLHIIIRFELEKALLLDELALSDLPGAWNEKYKHYLGIVPPNDFEGVLQDVHWYSGAIGYFPTYLLGALFAAQIYEKFIATYPHAESEFREGNFLTLKNWLNQNIHQHGRKFSSVQLMKAVTGKEPTPEPYISYLNKKYREIYK